MRAPFPFFSPGRLACLALLAPTLALAQSRSPALVLAQAADPAASTAPLAYQAIASLPRPAQPQLGAQDWRAANAAVSDFPRGHADIAAWEAAQGSGGAAPPAQSGQPAAPMQHGHPPSAGHATPPPAAAHPHAMHPQMQMHQHQKGQP